MSLTIAQAESSSGTGLIVSDTAANIAQGVVSDPALLTKVASFTLTANGMVSAGMADHLAALGAKFHLGGYRLNVQDTLANIEAPANAAGVALATAVEVADMAYVLLSAPLSAFAHVASVSLIGAPTLDTAQVAHLLSLPHFTIDPSASVTLSDTAGNIGAAISGGPAWFPMLSAVAVRLDGSAMGAYSANLIEGAIKAGKHVTFVASAGDSTLNISAAAAGIAGNATALGDLATHVPLAFTLTGTSQTVTAAQGASLAGLAGFASHLSGVTVSDTAANVSANAPALFGQTFAAIDVTSGTLAGTAPQLLNPSLHLAGASATLSASASVTAAQALALNALHGFALAQGVTLTVADTIANLLADGQALAGHVSAMAATDSETLDAADATSLAAIAASVGSGFSLGGHTLTISDTAANLLTLSAGAKALAGVLSLSASATVSAAQFTALTLPADFTLGGHTLSVVDTAAALAALPQNKLGLAQSVTLSAGATVDAQQANVLAAEPGFSTGGYALTIEDTAAALAALSPAASSVATSLEINANQTVTASQLAALAAFGHTFSANGFTITVADTAAALDSLGIAALALTSHAILSQSAVVSAAQAATLGALPGFSKASQVTLTVQDSLANLLALNGTAPAAATSLRLNPGTAVTLTAAGADLLASLAGFTNTGASITVADSIANLQATAGWSAVATATDVVDSAYNLITNAALSLVQNAGSVGLSAGATISAAAAATLATIPHFARGSALLIVADTAAALTANAAAVTSEASLVEVTGVTQVTAAGAQLLAQIGDTDPLTFATGARLIIADTYANIIAQANVGGLAIATGLTIEDTPANLALALAHGWGSIGPTYALTAGGTVSAAELGGLAALGSRFVSNGYALDLADTASGVLGLSAVARDMAASIAITDVSANVTAAVLNTLHSEITAPLTITLSDNGHVSVSTTAYSSDQAVIDSITNTGAVIVTGTAAGVAGIAATLQADPVVGGVTISDSPGDIESAYGTLAGLTLPISVTLTASGTLNAQTLALIGAGTLTMAGFTITLADTVAAIAALSSADRALAGAVTVTDDTADLTGSAFDALHALVTQPLAIHLTDPQDPLSVTAATYASDTAQVDAVNNATALQVTGGAADFATIASGLAADSRVTSVLLSDSAADIDAVSAALTPLAAKLSIYLTAGGTVGATTLALFADAASLYHTGLDLSLAGSVAGVTGLSATARDLAVSIAVTDVSTNLTTSALNTLEADVTVPLTITLTDAGQVGVTTATYTADQSVIDSLQNTGVVAVSGSAAGVANLAYTLDNDPVVGGIAISDSASAIAASIGTLDTLTKPVAVTLTASGTVNAQTLAFLAGTSFTPGTYSLTVADSEAAIAGLSGAARALAGAVSVDDTVGDLTGAAFDTLRADVTVPLTIHLTDPQDVLSVTAATYSADEAQVDDVTNASSLQITGSASAIAAMATTLANDARVTGVVLTDTATAIDALAASLSPVTGKLAIYLTAGGTVGANTLALFAGAASLSHGGVNLALATNVAGFGGLSASALDLAGSIAITDVAANVTTSVLNTLQSEVSVPLSITLSNAGHISVTAATYLADQTIIDDIQNTGVVTVTGNAASIASLAGALNADTRVAGVSITDSAANIASSYGNGLSALTKPAAITLNGGGTVNASTLALLAASTLTAGSYAITLADTVADIAALGSAARALASSVAVTDSTADLTSAAFNTLQADVAVPLTIQLSDPQDVLSVTAATYSADAAQVDAVTNATSLQVSGAAAAIAPLASALGSDSRVTSVLLTDGATAIDAAVASLAPLTSKLSIVLTASGTVTAPTLAMFANAVSLSHGGINLALASSVGGVLGLSPTARDLAASMAITDVSASLTTSALNMLQADVTVPLTITLTDAGHIGVSTATYTADQGVIDDIQNQGVVTVSGTAAAIAGLYYTLDNDAVVGSVAITDSASAIAANVASLLNLTKPLAITLNAGGTVNAQTLALIAGSTLTAGNQVITLSDNAADILSLSGAARALAGAVVITDNTADLTSAVFDALRADVSVPLSITLTDPQDPLSVTAATYSADTTQIDAITNASSLQVTGSASALAPLAATLAGDSRVTGVVLTDAATTIDGLIATLAPLSSKLAIYLTAGGTVGAATLDLFAGAAVLSHGGITLALATSIAGFSSLSANALALAGSIALSDVSTNLTTSVLNTLQSEVTVPLSITLTDTGHISVTAGIYLADQGIIDDIQNTGVVTVTGTAASIASLAGTLNADARVAGVSITDSAADITTAYGNGLNTLTKPVAVALNASGTVDANTLAFLAASTLTTGGNSVTLADTEANIAALSSGARALAGAVTVNDSTADLTGAAFDTLRADVSVPLAIHLTDPQDVLSVTAATYSADTAQVDAVNNATSLQVTGSASTIAPLAATLASDSRVTSVALTDAATTIDGLVTTLAPLASKLAITLTASGTVGAATLNLFASATSLYHTGINLALATSIAGFESLSAGALGLAGGIALTDVSTNLTAAVLNTLQGGVSVPLTITLTDTGHISVTAATYIADQGVIDDIANTGVVTVTGTAALIAYLAGTLNADTRVGGVGIADSAAAINASYGSGLSSLSKPVAVTLSGGGTVTASTLAFLAASTLTAGSYAMTLADNVADIAALSGAARALASTVAVTDSTADLTGAAFDTLHADVAVPLTIALSDPQDVLSVTASTYSADTAQVDAVTNASSLQVTGAAAAIAPLAATLASDARVTAVLLTDTATGIAGSVSNLAALTGKLSITVTQGGTVSAATLALLADAQSLSDGGITYTLADTAAHVIALTAPARDLAGSIAIADVSGSLTTSVLNTLEADVSVPLTITLTDAGHVSVTAATYTADQTIIDAIQNAGVVTVTGSAAGIAALVSTLNSDPVVGAVAITDSAGDVAAYYAELSTLDAPISLTLNAGSTVNAQTLALIAGTTLATGGNSITLEDSEAAIAGLTPTERALATAVVVSDSTGDLTGTAFDTLKADVSVPLTIDLTDPQDTLSVTAATYSADTAQVDAVSNATSLDVTGSPSDIAPLASALAADSRVTGIVLTGTAAAIDGLVGDLAVLTSKLDITVTQSGTVTGATLAMLAGAASLSDNGITYDLADTVGGVTGLSAPALALASSIAISDVAANLTTAALNTLQASVAVPLTITLTDNGAVSVSAATYAADQTIIDDLTNTGVVTVTGAANAFGAIAAALSTDPTIAAVLASGTAATVVANLATLLTIGNTLTVTLTDTQPIGVTLVPELMELPSLVATGITVADTGSNIAAIVEAASEATLGFLNARSVQLNANSVVSALDEQALVSLNQFSDGGYTLSVWDTASHLTSSLYLADLENSDVTGIYLKTGGTPLTETASGMLALLALPNFHINNPDNSTNSVTLSDSAAHLSADYGVLHADAATLAGVAVTINASATITDAVLTQLQSLDATAANGGVTMTVRDAAATIAANAPTQSTSAYITPSVWALSGSATVTESIAAYLGGLSGFSAGAYTLTVSETGTTIISVSDANNLAALGSALAITGGGGFAVQGTVAQLSGLSNAALALVTPEVSDSFSNIVTDLTASSALLGGTLAVNDSESVTAANAEAFFGLIKVGSGAGIAASQVSFGGHIESVSGNIANLESLTGLPAWTANASLTSAFTLTAADNVANLINSAHRTFLEGLSASTLSGNLTTTAASAESLFLIENQIHFSKGGHTLTVEDNPTDLLNEANGDGIALANTVELDTNGPYTIDVAQAEPLLQLSNFMLNESLTIADTPDNLLDGTLSGLIADTANNASFLHVELNTSTTVDAPTAAELVAIPDFTDPSHYLTISDDPTYLVNSAYLAAENIAYQVTIPADETETASMIYRLSEVPNFTPGANHLILAASSTVNDAVLGAIGSFGSSYETGGFSITMTANDTSLTVSQYESLLNDNVVTNGHLFGAVTPAPTVISASDSVNEMNLTLGVAANGSYLVFDANGNGVTIDSATPQNSGANELLTFADTGTNFSITESLGSGAPSAPVVLLDTASLTAALGSGTFSSTPDAGSIQVGTNEYVDLVNSTPANPTVPVLVYNGTTHILSLDVPGSGLTPLITLGGTAPPSTLTNSEIFIKTHG